MEFNEGPVTVFWPSINGFEDTGPVWHTFADGSKIIGKVVRSNDSEGYAIELTFEGLDDEPIVFTLDRLAALCVTDVLIKNIMNQQEVYNAERDKQLNELTHRMGQSKGNKQPDDATGEDV